MQEDKILSLRDRQRAWINAIRSATGDAYAAIAKKSGVAPSTVVRFMNDERSSHALSATTEAKIGERYRSLPKPETSTVEPIHTMQIEVRGDVQAGVWRDALEWPFSDWYAITVPIDAAYPGVKRYGLLVRGESMNRIFPDGSVVVVVNFSDIGRSPKTGELVVAIQRSKVTNEFEATVKAVQILESGDVILWPQSYDPDFATPIKVPKLDHNHDAGIPDVVIQALVVASYRPNPRVTF
ncbi:LexA family protein [Kozakia baliensis]|uniref:LexA family protein n=1 Tax=Kozakia baliensis TaxID=153496 RepID=UPI00068BB9A1|nr:S24 family peptidase [Kozakia baliensis]